MCRISKLSDDLKELLPVNETKKQKRSARFHQQKIEIVSEHLI